MYITVPFLEVDRIGDDTLFFNSVSLVVPQGQVAAHYRKNCPWPHPEKSWATPFEGVHGAYCDTEFGRVGLAICFDIHTILAKYADHSLWALLYPIAWVGDTRLWFSEQLPQRLSQCTCPHYILGANWATRAPQVWAGAGFSTVYGPGGQVLATAGEGWKETIVYAIIPTSDSKHEMGTLKLSAYQQWSESQVGSDYWQRGNNGPHSFMQEMARRSSLEVEPALEAALTETLDEAGARLLLRELSKRSTVRLSSITNCWRSAVAFSQYFSSLPIAEAGLSQLYDRVELMLKEQQTQYGESLRRAKQPWRAKSCQTSDDAVPSGQDV